jgi:hypothetical protein
MVHCSSRKVAKIHYNVNYVNIAFRSNNNNIISIGMFCIVRLKKKHNGIALSFVLCRGRDEEREREREKREGPLTSKRQ